jgi:hypothetical protein
MFADDFEGGALSFNEAAAVHYPRDLSPPAATKADRSRPSTPR